MWCNFWVQVRRTGKNSVSIENLVETDICVSFQNKINPWLNVLGEVADKAMLSWHGE